MPHPVPQPAFTPRVHTQPELTARISLQSGIAKKNQRKVRCGVNFTQRVHTRRSHNAATEDKQGVTRVTRSHTTRSQPAPYPAFTRRSHTTRSHPAPYPAFTHAFTPHVHTPRSHTRSHAVAAEDEHGFTCVTRSHTAFTLRTTPRVHTRVHTQSQLTTSTGSRILG